MEVLESKITIDSVIQNRKAGLKIIILLLNWIARFFQIFF
jgi:hypothetical protein